MSRRIYQDEGAGDCWIATSIEDARREYDSYYELDPIMGETDDDFFREIPLDEVVPMIMVGERTVSKNQIPDDGIVREDGYLIIEATAEQWLSHIGDEIFHGPWLVGEW